ncbi:hypothetical protein C8J57DRAFT_1223123 [Mycena rebaudengoi]|nr:hypothetical protein C8J57DRAFT_1223123 [Mycena rebaudengoi]
MIDLSLARLSLLIDIASYILLPFSPSGLIFTLFIALRSLGSGFVPAVRSIALDIVTRRNGSDAVESGKLFGALGVVQAVCHGFGPALIGFGLRKSQAKPGPKPKPALALACKPASRAFLAENEAKFWLWPGKISGQAKSQPNFWLGSGLGTKAKKPWLFGLRPKPDHHYW